MDGLLVGAGLWLGAIAATGAYLDLRYRRLPNWLCAIALVSGAAFVLAVGGWQDMAWSLAHAVAALAVGIGLYALGGIGAGDAKYYGALAAWFPLRYGLLLLGVVSLAGLLLLIVWFAWRLRRRGKAPRSGDDPFDKLPYGMAIALGALFTFVAVYGQAAGVV